MFFSLSKSTVAISPFFTTTPVVSCFAQLYNWTKSVSDRSVSTCTECFQRIFYYFFYSLFRDSPMTLQRTPGAYFCVCFMWEPVGGNTDRRVSRFHNITVFLLTDIGVSKIHVQRYGSSLTRSEYFRSLSQRPSNEGARE